MAEHTEDIFPVYDGQDLSAFTVLMVHHAASRLGLIHEGINPEDEMRTRIEEVRPGVPRQIDHVIEAYRDWIDAINQGASTAVREGLQSRTEKLRLELSAAVSN